MPSCSRPLKERWGRSRYLRVVQSTSRPLINLSTRRSDSESVMSSAFVLMPFAEDFVGVYAEFIKPVLKDAGFSTVDRANDIESQQNILRDILDKIDKSDLIIADLTSANPNVFYELGIAHALRKPVILVTQSIEEVPFDLKPYRLLEYSTNFVKIEKAKDQLLKYAKGFLKGDMPFGSPVTDFRQEGPGPSRGLEAVPYNTSQKDERGFLDHLIDINSGYNRIANVVQGVSRDMGVLNQAIVAATQKNKLVAANLSASSPTAVRKIYRQLAERISQFKNRLNKANAEYSSIARNTENSLEFVLSFRLNQSEVIDPEIDEQISSLRKLQSSAIIARDSYLSLAEKMDQAPRMERRLNREFVRGSEEVRVMANNLDKTNASVARALKDHA